MRALVSPANRLRRVTRAQAEAELAHPMRFVRFLIDEQGTCRVQSESNRPRFEPTHMHKAQSVRTSSLVELDLARAASLLVGACGALVRMC